VPNLEQFFLVAAIWIFGYSLHICRYSEDKVIVPQWVAVVCGKPIGKSVLSGLGIGAQVTAILIMLYQCFLHPYVLKQSQGFLFGVVVLSSGIVGLVLARWLYKTRLYKS
jgi:hypothetical protein